MPASLPTFGSTQIRPVGGDIERLARAAQHQDGLEGSRGNERGIAQALASDGHIRHQRPLGERFVTSLERALFCVQAYGDGDGLPGVKGKRGDLDVVSREDVEHLARIGLGTLEGRGK